MPEALAATEVLATHTPELFAVAMRRAAAVLRAGGLVALPTETVYGLAANALDARAVAAIYEVKGRPAHNPIIVHVAGLEMARTCVKQWPPVADKLAQAFWPGPLTLVLPRSRRIPEIVTAGGPTVGVRWPAHPFTRAVIRECGFPLAAPSANLAGRLSPTNAEHVLKAFGGRISLIVDGGQSQVGLESTVVDLTGESPRILRPGMIHEQSLFAVTGEMPHAEPYGPDTAGTLRSPGLQEKHYAPRAKLRLLHWRNAAELESRLAPHAARAHVIAHTHIPGPDGFAGVSVIPRDAEAFARAIYAELHRCDEAGAALIVVEALPDGVEWRAIEDRLRRAATD